MWGIFSTKTLEETPNFKKMGMLRRGYSRDALKPSLSYQGPVPISREKKNVHVDLLPLIPDVSHSYYRNLVSTDSIRNALPDNPSDDSEDDHHSKCYPE